MRILVTGHSGLIGSHIVEKLIQEKHKVYGISTTPQNKIKGCTNRYFDLRNKTKTLRAIQEIKPEIVYHCAANAAENKSAFSPIEITTSNYNTFYNVLVGTIRAGSLKRFIFTSSIAVYGAIHVPFREQDLPLPQDLYGVAKLAIERALQIMASVYDFEYVIVRPHNVYGERQRMDDPYRNVVALFMNQLLADKPYTIYGNGSMKRCFSYVGDVVDSLIKCGFEEVENMTFNIGSDSFYSIQELSDLIQKTSGISIPPQYEPTRVHEVHTAVADHTLSKKVLNYKETSLYEGVEKMWKWAKGIGHVKYKYDEVEIKSDKLPQNWK